jgi:ethylbenzene dioxygenase alpha subunit
MDDGENWENCTTVNRGVVTRQERLHYRCGINRQVDDHPVLPGLVYRGQYNDANQRNFYQHWVDMMEAPTAKDIPYRWEPKFGGLETRDFPGLDGLEKGGK